jgi:hypothetical protein
MLPIFRKRTRTHRDQAPRCRRQVRLLLEELENRSLPSTTALSNLVAAPALRMTPLASAYPDVHPFTVSAIRQAYGVNNLAYDGAGQTIAIVTAFDDPTIQQDVAQFDSQFGLAPAKLQVVQAPAMDNPTDNGWSFETALDVEWAHAIAPQANLLLVEAQNDTGYALLNAVDTARNTPGVSVVSMSWGGSEFNGETVYDSYFTTPVGHVGGNGVAGGITFVAASGDLGAWYGPIWPSVSPNVLAVGGTTLAVDAIGTYSHETGWVAGGGGYSSFETEPGYQQAVQQSGARTTPDVAYNSNPLTGFYIFNSDRAVGWYDAGGTSAGTPQWAGLVALANQGLAANGQASLGSFVSAQELLYAAPANDFHDVTLGYNGFLAGPGYDLVTGRGTPKADALIPDLIKLDKEPSSAPPLVSNAASTSPTAATLKDPFFLARRVDIVQVIAGPSSPYVPVPLSAGNQATAAGYPPGSPILSPAARGDAALTPGSVANAHASLLAVASYSQFVHGSDGGDVVPDGDGFDKPPDKDC